MAKILKVLVASLLALVMMTGVALPALAAVEINGNVWYGDELAVDVTAGTDAYTYMALFRQPAHGYEFSGHFMGDGEGPQTFVAIDTVAHDGTTWKPNGTYVPGESNYEVLYCCDVETMIVDGTYYKRVNLEDSNYYSEKEADQIRAIVVNSYPYVSVEEMKASLEGKVENAAELTRNDLIAAVQTAIWCSANEVSAEDLRYQKSYRVSDNLQWGYPLYDTSNESGLDVAGKRVFKTYEEVGARIDGLVDYLLSLAPVKAEDGEIVITKLDIVNSYISGPRAVDGAKYDVVLNVELNQGADSNDSVVIKAFKNGEQVSEITVGEATSYEIALTATDNDQIKVIVSGVQELEKGVYFYTPKAADVDGDGIATEREASQSLVGVSMGATPVYAEANAEITEGKIVNKTATKLYDDEKYTDVTLEIEGDIEYNAGSTVDIVIALGPGIAAYTAADGTYTGANAIISLVKPLIEQGIKVKLGLVGVETLQQKFLDLTELDPETFEAFITEKCLEMNSLYSGPTNLEGPIRTATEMLDADTDVPAENKFMYVVSTGRTYWWENDDGVPTTIVTGHRYNGVNYICWSHRAWQRTRINHTSLYAVPGWYNDDWNAYWEDIQEWVANDGDQYAYYVDFGKENTDNYVKWEELNGDYTVTNRYAPAIVDNNGLNAGFVLPEGTTISSAYGNPGQQHALNYERAQYEAYLAFEDAKAAGYNVVAVCSEGVNFQNGVPRITKDSAWASYGWTSSNQIGHSFMNFLAGGTASTAFEFVVDENGDPIINSANNGSGVMKEDFFPAIDLSGIEAGEATNVPFVEDFIGTGADYDFKFTGNPEKLVLALNGTTYVTTEVAPVNGATASYVFSLTEGGKVEFTLDYYAGNDTTTERFVWSFYEKVVGKISLTYQLELVTRNETPGRCYIAYTNQSAILYPTGDRSYGQVFPLPFVDYCNPDNTPPTVSFKSGTASNISFMLIDKATGEVEFLYKVDVGGQTFFEIPYEEGKISAVFIKQSTSGMFWIQQEVDDEVLDAVIECLKDNNPSYKGHNAVCFGAGDHKLEFKKNKFVTYTFSTDTVITESDDKAVASAPVEKEEAKEEPVEEEVAEKKAPAKNKKAKGKKK